MGGIVVVLRTEAENACELDKETQVKLRRILGFCHLQGCNFACEQLEQLSVGNALFDRQIDDLGQKESKSSFDNVGRDLFV